MQNINIILPPYALDINIQQINLNANICGVILLYSEQTVYTAENCFLKRVNEKATNRLSTNLNLNLQPYAG